MLQNICFFLIFYRKLTCATTKSPRIVCNLIEESENIIICSKICNGHVVNNDFLISDESASAEAVGACA